MELTQNDTMPDAFSKHIRDRENADRPAGEEEQDTSEQDAAEPVSYTHLDVYKRQDGSGSS